MADATDPELNTAETVLPVSRRNLFGGFALAMLVPSALSAAQVSNNLATFDPAMLHNLLRGVILLEQFGDAVIDADAAALLEQIETYLPEAPLMAQIYRAYPPRAYTHPWREETEAHVEALHKAIAKGHAVSFQYTDLEDMPSSRRVLPLALVHPSHGIQLLAWCELRADYRKFFVRSMAGVTGSGVDFSARRIALLQGLIEREIDPDEPL